MRLPFLASVALLAACASGQTAGEFSPTPAGGPVNVVQRELGIYSGDVVVDNQGVTARVERGIDEVWPALAEVYQDLGITVNYVEPDSRSLGVVNVRVRRINGERMAEFFNCGSGMAGPNANLYDVFASAVTQLAPAENGATTVRTEASAVARSREHGVSPVNCTSTGNLEKEILKRLNPDSAAPGA